MYPIDVGYIVVIGDKKHESNKIISGQSAWP